MNGADEPLDGEDVELADTRPDMLWFPVLGAVPVDLAALLFTLTLEAMAMTKDWRVIVIGCVVWWLSGKLVAQDYHAINRVNRYVASTGWNLDGRRQHGTASTSPFPLRSKRLRGVA